MPWVISAVVSWIVFYFLVDPWHLKRTIFGGLFALTLASVVDWGGNYLDLYRFYDLIIPWATCSMFYKFGPVLTMGVLFVQFLPRKRWLQVLHILVTSFLYLGMEILIYQTGVAKYYHWNFFASYAVDIGAFTMLTWVGQTFKLSPKFRRQSLYKL